MAEASDDLGDAGCPWEENFDWFSPYEPQAPGSQEGTWGYGWQINASSLDSPKSNSGFQLPEDSEGFITEWQNNADTNYLTDAPTESNTTETAQISDIKPRVTSRVPVKCILRVKLRKQNPYDETAVVITEYGNPSDSNSQEPQKVEALETFIEEEESKRECSPIGDDEREGRSIQKKITKTIPTKNKIKVNTTDSKKSLKRKKHKTQNTKNKSAQKKETH